MRPWIAILVCLPLALSTLACGGSSKGASSAAAGTPVTAYFPHDKDDRDNDGDRNNDDFDLYFGHAAGPADRRESVALTRRYYAAAAAANGAEACSLLVPFFAESVVEQYGHVTGISGRTCAVVMSKLFRSRHAQLASENATLRIPAVRVQQDSALAILEFPTIPEVRKLLLRRVGGSWRVIALLDSAIE
jgi:hypothetical protein